MARETVIRSRSEEKKAIFSSREALIRQAIISDAGLWNVGRDRLVSLFADDDSGLYESVEICEYK